VETRVGDGEMIYIKVRGLWPVVCGVVSCVVGWKGGWGNDVLMYAKMDPICRWIDGWTGRL
jgi:hypothetical protein